jgi:hypothetical protein
LKFEILWSFLGMLEISKEFWEILGKFGEICGNLGKF